MLVLSVMTNTAQFESAEEREQEVEAEEMWPWPGVILESAVSSTGGCSTQDLIQASRCSFPPAPSQPRVCSFRSALLDCELPTDKYLEIMISSFLLAAILKDKHLLKLIDTILLIF